MSTKATVPGSPDFQLRPFQNKSASLAGPPAVDFISMAARWFSLFLSDVQLYVFKHLPGSDLHVELHVFTRQKRQKNDYNDTYARASPTNANCFAKYSLTMESGESVAHGMKGHEE
jgi:hypothetical protein